MYRTNWTVERDDIHGYWIVVRYTDVAKIMGRFDTRQDAETHFGRPNVATNQPNGGLAKLGK
jgi:hypothetical protein